MALIPHGFFPRSQMDMDSWMRPFGNLNTLEAFDPFDDLDTSIGRNMQWLQRPDWMQSSMPSVPQKYRVTLDCSGFAPGSIKTDWRDGNLVVSAHEENNGESGDFSIKNFQKTYSVPQNAERDKMVSFMTGDGQLCIEVPLKETQQHMNQDLFPQVVDDNGNKMVKMHFAVPQNIAPEHIDINVKDRCLIVKAEEKKSTNDGVSKFHYYKKTTLPENTDFKHLQCNYDNDSHQISIQAPVNMNWKPTNNNNNKHVPLENKKHQTKMLRG